MRFFNIACLDYVKLTLPTTLLTVKLTYLFLPSPFRPDCKDTEGRRKGVVCLFYKENLPIEQRLDFKTQIDETIVAEIKLRNKKVFIVLTYKTTSMPIVIRRILK